MHNAAAHRRGSASVVQPLVGPVFWLFEIAIAIRIAIGDYHSKMHLLLLSERQDCLGRSTYNRFPRDRNQLYNFLLKTTGIRAAGTPKRQSQTSVVYVSPSV